jgi:hypothetical protein
MSGGHFDYNQYKIEQIADDIDLIVDQNDSTEKDGFGQDRGCHYPSEVIDKFKEASITLRRGATMTQRIDWLLSGDDGEDSFLKRWKAEVV